MHSPAGDVTLGVQTEAGVDYLIYSSPDLETWTPLGSPFPGTGGYMEIPVPSPQSAAFFRVGKPGNWNAFTWDDFAWQ